jgi:hypothetical protein
MKNDKKKIYKIVRYNGCKIVAIKNYSYTSKKYIYTVEK